MKTETHFLHGVVLISRINVAKSGPNWTRSGSTVVSLAVAEPGQQKTEIHQRA